MSIDTLASSFSENLAETAAQVRASVVQVRAGRGGIGSGVIWRTSAPDATGEAEATVITNAHVVRAAADTTFTLRLADSREIQATLVAIDPSHDLAALRTRASGLQAAQIGNSTTLRVGELVIAVGNPFGREGAVTVGVVAARAPADPDTAVEPAESDAAQADATTPQQQRPDGPDARPDADDNTRRGARGRWRLPGGDLIQADIRLYPGNSGGPLTDAHGRVVGINSMVGGGLAFAIPGHAVAHFLEEVGRSATPVYLGVQVLTAPLSPLVRQRASIAQESAALVSAVEPGSPADAAGVLLGDVLLAIDGQPIRSAEQLPRLLNRSAAGNQPRTLSVLRGGERREIALVPAVRAAA